MFFRIIINTLINIFFYYLSFLNSTKHFKNLKDNKVSKSFVNYFLEKCVVWVLEQYFFFVFF